MKTPTLALLASAVLVLVTPAQAEIKVFSVNLSGANEATPNLSTGTGTATITFDTSLSTMRVQASFSDLVNNSTNAHIHCCTASPGTAAAGVATVTPTFTGFPSGVKSGSYDNTFNMLDAGSWNAAFITGNGGTAASAFTALLAGATAGQAYLNIHSAAPYTSGEIRGFLAPVPEASTYAMMLAGLVAVGALASRSKRV